RRVVFHPRKYAWDIDRVNGEYALPSKACRLVLGLSSHKLYFFSPSYAETRHSFEKGSRYFAFESASAFDLFVTPSARLAGYLLRLDGLELLCSSRLSSHL